MSDALRRTVTIDGIGVCDLHRDFYGWYAVRPDGRRTHKRYPSDGLLIAALVNDGLRLRPIKWQP